MKTTKRILSILIILAMIVGICVVSTASFGASGTGTGLASWALNAYYSNWSYVYGGASAGAVDCSGLIYSYAGGYRVGDAQMGNSSYTGSVSSGIPNIHGLGLYQPGHVGVYVGDGMAVDARGDDYGVCYESAYSHNWTIYFKVPGVSYPSTGWEEFNGDYYYYQNGEYLSNTSKTIDGVTYYFDASGASSKSPSSSSESSSDTSSSSSSSDSGSLKKGSQGSRVEELQQRLYDLGYYNGSVDGDFGEMTEKAFMLFQKTAGLYEDGIAGSDAELLFSDDAPKYSKASMKSNKEDLAQTGAEDEEKEDTDDKKDEDKNEEKDDEEFVTYKNGDFDEEIIKIQERLIKLEYLDSDADGSFGTDTEKAVKTFQGANGVTQSGEVDKLTYTLLFSEKAKVNPHHENEKAKETTAEVVAKQAPTRISNTEVELKTNELSSKALAGVSDSLGFKTDSNGNNFQFIFILGIMIVVMLITFAVVYAIEKKKMKKRNSHRFQ